MWGSLEKQLSPHFPPSLRAPYPPSDTVCFCGGCCIAEAVPGCRRESKRAPLPWHRPVLGGAHGAKAVVNSSSSQSSNYLNIFIQQRFKLFAFWRSGWWCLPSLLLYLFFLSHPFLLVEVLSLLPPIVSAQFHKFFSWIPIPSPQKAPYSQRGVLFCLASGQLFYSKPLP